jgi:O-antigen/teichoic acid export membrane protein
VSRTLVRSGGVVLGATLVWHLSNFGFNVIAAHLLNRTHYGTLAAVTALLYLASPLLVAVQTIASRLTTTSWTAGDRQRISALYRYYAVRVGLIGLLVASVVVLASSGIARFLRIESMAPVAILAAALGISMVTHLQRGILQGTSSFDRYALSTLVEAVAKIVLTVVLLLLVWRNVDAAVLAIVLGSVCGLIANTLLLRFLPPAAARAEALEHPYAYSLAALTSLALLATLLSADVIAAKRYLSPSLAGVYAAVSLSGKVVYFLTSSLTFLIFPHFSARQELGLDSRRQLATTPIVVFYVLFPKVVIHPLFGTRYDAAASTIRWSALVYGIYAVCYLTSMYLLSQRDLAGVVILAFGAVAELWALYVFHSSVLQIIGAIGTVFAATAVALLLAAFRPDLRRAS